VLFAEVAYIRAGGLEDPQAQETAHGHQSEVVRVGGLAGGGEQGLELQVLNPESVTRAARPAGGHARPASAPAARSMTQVR
jgi:hypothetical protein